jgi:dihydrolipoamide dehydrogenase
MYDYIIVGGGPGGIELAFKATMQGKKVLLIEQDKLGGLCLHHGCIPTKALRHQALTNSNADLPVIMDEVFARVNMIYQGLLANIEQLKIEVINGKASFIDEHTVEVNGIKQSGEKIIYCGGSLPISLNIEGIDGKHVYDSTSMLAVRKKSHHLLILGGGYIGMEWATIFNHLGVKVTIIESEKNVLNNVDDDVRRRFLSIIKNENLSIMTKTKITKVISKEEGIIVITDNNQKIDGDMLLVAIGRKPNTIVLPQGISIIGDASGHPMLAHKSSKQARDLLNPLANKESLIPSVIFTIPEIALVGPSEQQLIEKGIDFKSYKRSFMTSAKRIVDGDTEGFIKIIVRDNKIISSTILGSNGEDLLPFFILAIQQQIAISDLKQIVFPHPTTGELIGELLAMVE